MAEWYVDFSKSGAGDGSSGNPWDWDDFVTSRFASPVSADDTIFIRNSTGLFPPLAIFPDTLVVDKPVILRGETGDNIIDLECQFGENFYGSVINFTKTGGQTNVYQVNTSGTPQRAWDNYHPDFPGLNQMINVGSIAEVDATPNSVFFSGGVMYVRTWDDQDLTVGLGSHVITHDGGGSLINISVDAIIAGFELRELAIHNAGAGLSTLYSTIVVTNTGGFGLEIQDSTIADCEFYNPAYAGGGAGTEVGACILFNFPAKVDNLRVENCRFEGGSAMRLAGATIATAFLSDWENCVFVNRMGGDRNGDPCADFGTNEANQVKTFFQPAYDANLVNADLVVTNSTVRRVAGHSGRLTSMRFQEIPTPAERQVWDNYPFRMDNVDGQFHESWGDGMVGFKQCNFDNAFLADSAESGLMTSTGHLDSGNREEAGFLFEDCVIVSNLPAGVDFCHANGLVIVARNSSFSDDGGTVRSIYNILSANLGGTQVITSEGSDYVFTKDVTPLIIGAPFTNISQAQFCSNRYLLDFDNANGGMCPLAAFDTYDEWIGAGGPEDGCSPVRLDESWPGGNNRTRFGFWAVATLRDGRTEPYS